MSRSANDPTSAVRLDDALSPFGAGDATAEVV